MHEVGLRQRLPEGVDIPARAGATGASGLTHMGESRLFLPRHLRVCKLHAEKS